MSARPWRGPFVAGGLVAVLLVLSIAFIGCSTTEVVRSGGTGSGVPTADSPTGAVALLLWSYDHRAIDSYGGLFTDDFRFVFATGDSAGLAFQSNPWGRIYEVVSAQHLFDGGGAEPAADGISTSIEGSVMYPGPGSLVDVPDPRPGRDPSVHRLVYATVYVKVRRHTGDITARGAEAFYVVRGDSAQTAVRDRGRWYIERWDEAMIGITAQSANSGTVAPTPTWGSLKALYLAYVRD